MIRRYCIDCGDSLPAPVTCRLVDDGGDWWCVTHDVLAEPEWPDAMVTAPLPVGLVCPLAGED